jgi:nucleoside-diphosphate-sugar epimerase
MFASLSQSAQAKFVPLIDGGRYPQYLVHVADLALLLRQFLEGEIDAPNRPVTVASSKAWPIRALLKVMARERGNKPRFVSVPWQVVWVALSAAEKAGLKLNYRSDSVLSLVYQNPHPDFESLAQLGIRVRDFRG